MKLATAGECVTGGQRDLRIRRREHHWRCAFDVLFSRAVPPRGPTRPATADATRLRVPSVPVALLSQGSFADFCRWAAEAKGQSRAERSRLPLLGWDDREAATCLALGLARSRRSQGWLARHAYCRPSSLARARRLPLHRRARLRFDSRAVLRTEGSAAQPPGPGRAAASSKGCVVLPRARLPTSPARYGTAVRYL